MNLLKTSDLKKSYKNSSTIDKIYKCYYYFQSFSLSEFDEHLFRENKQARSLICKIVVTNKKNYYSHKYFKHPELILSRKIKKHLVPNLNLH